MPTDLERLNAPCTSIEDAMTREYPEATASPCNECPWRRAAASGWLGPYTVEEWIETAHSELPIACHKTLPIGGGWGESTRQCKGAAIFRENVFKSPRNQTIAAGPADTERVFGTNAEFIDHHGGPTT